MSEWLTVEQFKDRYNVQNSDKDAQILEHISAACARIRALCHRDFMGDTEATPRYFDPTSYGSVLIDDAWEITSVAVDDGDGGTWSTVWAATDYQTLPRNGVGPDGQAGWPTTALTMTGGRWFPTYNYRDAVKVTAKWGWAAVPTAIVEATYLLAKRLQYEVAVPGGVTAPNADYGLPGSVLPRPYTVESLCKVYARQDRVVGVAG